MPISFRTKAVLKKLWHAAWNAHRRCTNTTHKYYKDYGGRGIEFRFLSVDACRDYLLTLPGHSNLSMWIDRVDNDGHYEIGNLQFTTRSESQKNRRRSRPPHNKDSLLQYHRRHGFDRCCMRLYNRGVVPREIAKLYGISRNTVRRLIGKELN